MKAEIHHFGSTSTSPKVRKITNQLYNVKVEFDIPDCSAFGTTAIIDTGASACCINKKVVPKEALEPLTNVFFNGLNSRQQATHKIKQGYFLIEGNKFRIPIIYAFDMNDSNGIEMLIGANFLRSMKGGIRIEGDEITIYKKVTKIKTSNPTEIAKIVKLEVNEEEFLEINESIYFNQEGSKTFLEQFKPVIERLKHQRYIGEEPLKHWKKNGEFCKLDIINPYITIEDQPLKHVTPAMEDSFKKHVNRFHQVAMDEESIPWIAFLVPGGLYEWLVMPFDAIAGTGVKINIEHIEGKHNTLADSLSRLVNLCFAECTGEMKELAAAALYSVEEVLQSPNAFQKNMKIICEEVMKISNHFQESSQKLLLLGFLLHLSNPHKNIRHREYVLFEGFVSRFLQSVLHPHPSYHFLSLLGHVDQLSILVVEGLDERSTSMVAIICRLSSHLVSRRATRAFVP
nr:RNA-directed DNA polymerase [Tanacetum cinerariifolium]